MLRILRMSLHDYSCGVSVIYHKLSVWEGDTTIDIAQLRMLDDVTD